MVTKQQSFYLFYVHMQVSWMLSLQRSCVLTSSVLTSFAYNCKQISIALGRLKLLCTIVHSEREEYIFYIYMICIIYTIYRYIFISIYSKVSSETYMSQTAKQKKGHLKFHHALFKPFFENFILYIKWCVYTNFNLYISIKQSHIKGRNMSIFKR